MTTNVAIKKFSKYTKYIVWGVFITVILMYAFNLLYITKNKSQTSYELLQEEYKSVNINPTEKHLVKINNFGMNLERIDIIIECNSDAIGYIKYKVWNDDKEICFGESNVVDILSSGVMSIYVGQNELKEITLELESNVDKTIIYYIDQNDYIRTKNVYEYKIYKNIKWFSFFVILLFCFLLILSCRINKIENKFLLFAIFFGIVSTFVVIPCSAPDEWRHFVRAYDISQGNWRAHDFVEVFSNKYSGTCEIPIEFFDLKNCGETNQIDWTDETNVKISYPFYLSMINKTYSGQTALAYTFGTEGKSILEYFPQILFLWISKIFGCNAFFSFYMARVGNLFISILLSYCAIKITPNLKNILVALYFVPLMTFLRGTSSNDGILYGIILLTVSIWSYAVYNRNCTSNKIIISLVLCFSYIAILKLPYVLLCLLFFFIEEENIRVLYFGKKEIKINKYIVVCLVILCSLIIYKIYNIIFGPIDNISSMQIAPAIGYFIKHPGYVSSLIIRTFIDSFYGYFSSSLVWGSLISVEIFYLCAYIYICLHESITIDMYKDFNLMYLLLFMFLWLCVIFVAFTWSDFTANNIWGLQGRYMTPLLPLIGLFFQKYNVKMQNGICVAYAVILSINFLTIFSIIEKYWV